jgi:transcriptional regulator with XRE-family HTH domain
MSPCPGKRPHRVALPFCHLTLKARKPVHREKYPDILRTWGDWIKARRLDLKLTKHQLSLNLNVSDITIYLWERNKVRPSLAQIPKIIEFLGRDPFEKNVQKIGDRIREYRRIHGLTQRRLAAQLGIDNTTLGSWERGEHRPIKELFSKLSSVLTAFPASSSKPKD